jgi:hypothetical protein
MTSKKKSAASRRNGRRSAGPKTDAGKAASARNALRHGLRAKTLLLPDENQEDFDQLHADLENQYQPQTPHERHLVDQAAIAQWMQLRADRYQREAEIEGLDLPTRISIFDRMMQVSGRLDRSYTKACDALARLQAARPKPPEPPLNEKNEKNEKNETNEKNEKNVKKEKDETPPARYQLTWVKGDGQREVLYRAENGIPVEEFSDDSGAGS